MGLKSIAALALAGALLAGCSGGTWQTDYDAPISAEVSRSWNVRNVIVNVPSSLTTSDVNSLAPRYDIVWHGEDYGDRRSQVAAILKEGITKGSRGLRGGRSVNFAVTLQHFHAVTPNAVARAPGAVHNITYVVQVLDARSGKPIGAPVKIDADLEAYVGSTATQAARQGQGQRVRIVDHIRKVTMDWLSIGPDQRGKFSGTGV